MDKPDLYVVARILNTLYSSEAPMKRTNVQLKLGLNYARFAEYLDWMKERGLVTDVGGEFEVLLALTPKGLDSYHRLVGWIRDTMKGLDVV